ncbi:hypothetical protein, partial [Rhizobium sp.]|uniref:hypothetical protein n=1 Tax=Rhizobium sp. TaxID=391 RepID=UPI003F815723
TELAETFARQSDVDGRQHEMIQRMRRRNHGFSCLLADADLRSSPAQFKMEAWNTGSTRHRPKAISQT